MAAATNPPKTNGSTGYKEIFTGPKGFDWNLELEGSEGHPKASVNQPFCFDFSLDADCTFSIRITFQHGIPIKNILPSNHFSTKNMRLMQILLFQILSRNQQA